MERVTIALPFPLDLRRTLGPMRRGSGDPTFRFGADGCWRATRTSEGPATLHLRHAGQVVEAEAWGPGARRALEGAPALLGFDDDPAAFAPEHPLVARLHRQQPGLRIGRSGAVIEALVPSILEQKVTGIQAHRSHRRMVWAYGDPAPGPTDLRLPPAPDRLADTPYYELHRMGVEKKRADTIRRVCARSHQMEHVAGLPADLAHQRLTAIPGVGAWTAAEVALVALGDADAVSVGDFHLPSMVSWALANEVRGTDERMLELLGPFAGHRGRVLRLLAAAGLFAPRRGPRKPLRDIARH